MVTSPWMKEGGVHRNKENNMRKLHYSVEINGVTFEAKHGERIHHIPVLTGATRLHEVYDRYSCKKEAVYDEWNKFYNEMNDADHCSFIISSHNANIFTLKMVVYDKEYNQYWFLYITPAHNRAVKIDNRRYRYEKSI